MSKKRMEVPFTQVSNELLLDCRLSMKAKGIYSYLYSKPSTWDFAAKRIAVDVTDGEDGVRSGLKELVDAGWIKADKQANGRISYTVLTALNTPNREITKQAKSQTGEIPTISNKDLEVIKSIYNYYVKNLSMDKKYFYPARAKAYIESLLKNGYTEDQLMGSVKNYFKGQEKKFRKGPAKFFANDKRSPDYRMFEGFLPDEEKPKEPVNLSTHF